MIAEHSRPEQPAAHIHLEMVVRRVKFVELVVESKVHGRADGSSRQVPDTASIWVVQHVEQLHQLDLKATRVRAFERLAKVLLSARLARAHL